MELGRDRRAVRSANFDADDVGVRGRQLEEVAMGRRAADRHRLEVALAPRQAERRDPARDTRPGDALAGGGIEQRHELAAKGWSSLTQRKKQKIPIKI